MFIYSDESFQLLSGRIHQSKSQTVLLDQVFGKLQLSILYLYLNIIIKGSFGHKTKSYPSLQVHIITLHFFSKMLPKIPGSLKEIENFTLLSCKNAGKSFAYLIRSGRLHCKVKT